MFCCDPQHLSIFRHNCVEMGVFLGVSMHPHRYRCKILLKILVSGIFKTSMSQICREDIVSQLEHGHVLLSGGCRDPGVLGETETGSRGDRGNFLDQLGR